MREKSLSSKAVSRTLSRGETIFSVQLDLDDWEQLQELAIETGGTKAQIARALMRIGVSEVKKRKRLMRDLLKMGHTSSSYATKTAA